MSKPVHLDSHPVVTVASISGQRNSPFHQFFDVTGPLAFVRLYSTSFISYDGIIALRSCSKGTKAFIQYLFDNRDNFPGINEYWKNRVASFILNPRLLFQAWKLNQVFTVFNREMHPGFLDGIEANPAVSHFHATLLSRSKDQWKRVSAPTALFKHLLPQVQTLDCQNYLRDLFSLRLNFTNVNESLIDIKRSDILQSFGESGLIDNYQPVVDEPLVEAAAIEPNLVLQLLQIREKRIQANVVAMPAASQFSIVASLKKASSVLKAKFASKAPLPARDPKIEKDVVSFLKLFDVANQLQNDKTCLKNLIQAGKDNRPAHPDDVARYQQMEERHHLLLGLTCLELPQVESLNLDEIFELIREFRSLDEFQIKSALSEPSADGSKPGSNTDQSLSLDLTA